MMNDANIVKALNHCTRLRPCEKCPLYKEGYFSPSRNACRAKLMEGAFNLINRQQAEIERLKGYNENLLTANTALSNEILDIKAEAVKEFADRLKARNKIYCINAEDAKEMNFVVDNLIKEMMEGEE